MERIVIPKLNVDVQFDKENVPMEYVWSGDVKTVEEYKKWNFMTIKKNDLSILICSSDNGIALGEYLLRYLIRNSCVDNIEALLSPDCDYWFNQGYEKAEQRFDELDDWVQAIIQFFIDSGDIIRIDVENDIEHSSFFVTSTLQKYEREELQEPLVEQIKKICEDAITGLEQKETD